MVFWSPVSGTIGVRELDLHVAKNNSNEQAREKEKEHKLTS